MKDIGQPERATQNRVLALFRDELGYRYLGDRTDRDGNSNVEEDLLSAWLTRSGYTPAQTRRTLARHLSGNTGLQPASSPGKAPGKLPGKYRGSHR